MTSLIKDCTFSNNKADVNGGAIVLGSFHVGDYHPHITGCRFVMNEAFRRGGAIYAVGDHMEIDSTIFEGNQVTAVSPDASTLPGSGGGATLVASNAMFTNCIFDSNTSTGNPTGAFEGGGGGAVNMSANGPQTAELGPSLPKFISCGFYNNSASGNTAAWGGAVNHLCDAGILKPLYVNCVFAGNSAQNDGGAVSNFTRVIGAEDGVAPALEPKFTNCTFTGNSAQRGGGIFSDGFLFMGTEILIVRIENTILWDNSATVSGPEIQTTGTHLNSYSLIEGSGGSGAWVASFGTDSGNNIDSNPGFTNAASPKGVDNIPANSDDGLHLGGSSPAVNEGNSAATGLVGITSDYAGVSRVLGSSVDMGAYERSGIVIPKFPLYWLHTWRPVRPGCLSCPWSVLLLDRVLQDYVWDGPAQLIEQDGGAAIITGHIVNADNNKIGFNVFLKLEKKQGWRTWSAQGGTYVGFTLEALRVAKVKHTLWSFWQLAPDSYLEGTGDVSGKLLLKTIPSIIKTGFQLGEGGNGWDGDFGLAGSFAYSGKVTIRNKRHSLAGVGSINVDAVLCEKDCTPLIEPSRALVQLPEQTTTERELSVYPIPARDQLTISAESLPSGKYSVKFYDHKGLLKKQETMDTDNGDHVLSLQGVEPGLYVLSIVSPTGSVTTRKLSVE
jgi:predicted outer membrane repeat protein